ncbi:MAG TPA: nucleoside recognition domain-containing protein [Rhodocyclaceae bacterium]
MEFVLALLLQSGRAAVELVLFVLLPVMIVMLTLMRLLEARGVLDWLVARVAPLLRPFGLTGLGVFAALQVNFVSFAAPLATLTLMEQRGTSNRHLAATLAMVLAMAQANASFPMAALGLKLGPVLLFSMLGGLAAAAATYYGFGRGLSAEEHVLDETLQHPAAEGTKGVLDVINRAGAEALRIAMGALPMLVISLMVVASLRASGVIAALTHLLSPVLSALSINELLVLPALTKYIGGGTAMMGVMDELLRSHQISVELMNRSIGFLLHPLDIPGVAVLITAGPRLGAVWRPAVLGACVGVLLRTAGHAFW